MDSIFTKIIKQEISCYKIEENENFIAFLDLAPLAEGHTLVVPKKQVDYIFDLDNKLYAEFWLFAKKISRKIEKAIKCKRVGIAVIGLEVPHAHIHLVPINNVQDINFAKPKLSLSKNKMEDITAKIKNA